MEKRPSDISVRQATVQNTNNHRYVIGDILPHTTPLLSNFFLLGFCYSLSTVLLSSVYSLTAVSAIISAT